MKDLALIKKTGQRLEIRSFIGPFYVHIDPKTQKIEVIKSDTDEDNRYTLSDGFEYTSAELILGEDNIRDFTIDKIL